MPKKKSIETSKYPMMSEEKELQVRELHMDGATVRDIARVMNSNTQMVSLWHKMLNLKPNTGSLQEEYGFDPKAKPSTTVRYDTPDQKKTGIEMIDNTMPEKTAAVFTVSSLL